MVPQSRGNGDDKMCWEPDKRKGFQVDGFYRISALAFLLIFMLDI